MSKIIEIEIPDVYESNTNKGTTYRPYTNAEELLKGSREHGHYLGNNANYYINVVRNDSIDICLRNERNPKRTFLLFNDLLNTFNWQYGTPCGVLE